MKVRRGAVVALWNPSDALIQGLQGLEFSPEVEERLAATRKYVVAPSVIVTDGGEVPSTSSRSHCEC
jgi:hypothetical protein